MTTSKTKTYNRDAAILYAQKWANSFNPQYPNFEKIGVENSDCANFVSQCLFAGGLAMKKALREISMTNGIMSLCTIILVVGLVHRVLDCILSTIL